MSGPAITVDGLSKKFRLYTDRRSSLKERVVRRQSSSYDEFWALRDVSLEVRQGSTYGLVGHNGSGKSTLLKLMAGIHRPTTGSITAHGRISALLELGAGFHPELSGRENILLNGSILGMSKRQILGSMDAIVEFSGLEQFIDTPVKVYSSGMYVRLGFSIAVNLDPEILIIDEIVAVGDEEFQRRCFDHLYTLRRRGVTIVFVSHSLPLVQTLCDEVAWLDHGRLRAIGPAVEVVDDYLREVNSAERDRLEGDEAAAHDAADEADGATSEAGGADVSSAGGSSPRGVGSSRHGSGEVRVTQVELLDGLGAPALALDHGAAMTVRLHYRTTRRVEDPVFGLAFLHETGLALAGPNTRLAGVATGAVEGDGHIDFSLPSLPLVPGSYMLTAAITDASTTHVYDHRERVLSFRVQPGPGFQPTGYVALDGRWGLPRPADGTSVADGLAS